MSLVQQLGSSQAQQTGPLPSKSFLQGSSLPSAVPIYCTAPAICARGSTSRWVCVSHGSYVTLTRVVIGVARRGAQRLGRNEAAADCTGKQTKRGAVGVRRRWGWDGGEMELQPLWDACSLVWGKKEKSSVLLIPNQHNVSRGDGKRSPSVALLGPRLMCRHLRGFQWSPTLGRVSWADRGMEGQGDGAAGTVMSCLIFKPLCSRHRGAASNSSPFYFN